MKVPKNASKYIGIVSYTLEMGVPHTCICCLCQVIKHILTGLCSCELTSTSPPRKCVTGKNMIPMKPWFNQCLFH